MVSDFNGVVVINKPADISSAKVVARVKKALNVKKAGHAGTLDPFATGVLICCLNQATRLAEFLLQGEKKYEAVLRLGVDTDTQDVTGKVIGTGNLVGCSNERIRTVCKRFTGAIWQKPPIFSALKHKGTPLYKLARSGKPVQKPARRVVISKLEITRIELPHVFFQVSCSAGTYIRTLCAEIGNALGCGGHLKKLTRTASSGFTIDEAKQLSEVERWSDTLAWSDGTDDRIIGMAEAVRHMPEIIANRYLAQKIRNGVMLIKTEIDLKNGSDNISKRFLKVVDRKKNLLAIVSDQNESKYYRYCCVFNPIN
jgi:tRNA pseudouridine55 synthase